MNGTDPRSADGPPAHVRVLIVDDQPLARMGVARILDLVPGMQVVGECADGDEVVEAAGRCRPDVIVMDMRMRRVDGAEATRRLAAARPDPPAVLALTTFDDDETLAAALSAGAAGFLLKDAAGDDIIRAVRTVAAGGAWLDPQVTGRVLATYRETSLPRAAAQQRVAGLTEREREVLVLMARGRSNQEIAAELTIGEGTVKTHIGHVLTKLGLRDRPAAIVFAFNHGVVTPGA